MTVEDFVTSVSAWPETLISLEFAFAGADQLTAVPATLPASVWNLGETFSSANAFNQDLSGWCVSLIPSPPVDFDTGAAAWTLGDSRPVWGTCPV